MKKIGKVFFPLIAMLILVACSDDSQNKNESPKLNANNYYDASLEEFDGLKKNNDYDNLNLNNTLLLLSTDIKSFSEINMNNSNISQTDALILFEKLLKDTFTENIDKNNCFFNSPEIEVNFGELTIEYPELYSSAYYSKIVDDKLPVSMFLYQTDTFLLHDSDEYLMMFSNCGLLKMNRGNFMRAIDKNRNLAGWMPRDNYPTYETISKQNYNETINFYNGIQTIEDAENYCNSYFNNLQLNENNGITFAVDEANIIQVDSEHQALFFFLTRSYNGIKFDSINSEGTYSQFSDGNEYYFDCSEALMCNMDEVEYYYLSAESPDIVSEKNIENIISLKNATDIVSSYMTPNIKFDVESVSLVYSNKMVTDEKFNSTARPTWKFVLKNANDNLTYMVFVDVENGNCYYYTF